MLIIIFFFKLLKEKQIFKDKAIYIYPIKTANLTK